MYHWFSITHQTSLLPPPVQDPKEYLTSTKNPWSSDLWTSKRTLLIGGWSCGLFEKTPRKQIVQVITEFASIINVCENNEDIISCKWKVNYPWQTQGKGKSPPCQYTHWEAGAYITSSVRQDTQFRYFSGIKLCGRPVEEWWTIWSHLWECQHFRHIETVRRLGRPGCRWVGGWELAKPQIGVEP